MKKLSLLLAAGLMWLSQAAVTEQAPQAEVVDVSMIWGRSPHNAFTSLVRYRGRWYCAFREGRTAVSPDGVLRLLTSADGAVWQPAAVFTYAGADLRAPKLSLAPDGQLLLSAAALSEEQGTLHYRSLGWLTRDARQWDGPLPLGDPGFWLGPVRWQRQRAFSIAFSPAAGHRAKMYVSAHGSSFSVHAEDVGAGEGPAEASLLFLSDGDAVSLMESADPSAKAKIGRSHPPYRGWRWTDLKVSLGASDLALLPDGRIVAAARVMDDTVRTSLFWLDPEAGTLEEFLKLPSGGDSGCPGIVYEDGLLWVSYHSSHQGRAMIYLAKVRLTTAEEQRKPKAMFWN